MKKGIAFFDFDGTITRKDTLLEFIRYTRGQWRFLYGMFLNLPWVLAWKLKFISNQAAKERVLTFFFRNERLESFTKLCNQFQQERLPALLRPKAMQEIIKRKKENCLVVVVSASPENWIQNWADELGLELIASRLEINNKRLTGRIQGKNCHGKEKVRRILEKHDMSAYERVCAYGDTSGDLPMLQLAGESYYKPFRG